MAGCPGSRLEFINPAKGGKTSGKNGTKFTQIHGRNPRNKNLWGNDRGRGEIWPEEKKREGESQDSGGFTREGNKPSLCPEKRFARASGEERDKTAKSRCGPKSRGVVLRPMTG